MERITFLGYPTCSTSKKAQKWLDEQGIPYDFRDIVIDHPSVDELTHWYELSGLPLRRLFNTSGMLYREQKVKEKLDAGIADDDALALLASNGMMVKRPIIVGHDFAHFGFKEDRWKELLS